MKKHIRGNVKHKILRLEKAYQVLIIIEPRAGGWAVMAWSLALRYTIDTLSSISLCILLRFRSVSVIPSH